jgi:hypothetical protein
MLAVALVNDLFNQAGAVIGGVQQCLAQAVAGDAG